MCIADDEFGPIEDKKFYTLLKKLRKLVKMLEMDEKNDL